MIEWLAAMPAQEYMFEAITLGLTVMFGAAWLTEEPSWRNLLKCLYVLVIVLALLAIRR